MIIMLKDKVVVWLVSITALVIVASVFLVSRMNLGSSKSDPTTTVDSNRQQLLEVQADDHVLGASDAAITLVEYSDYECSACLTYEPLVKQLAEEYAGRLRIVVRHFPLVGHKNAMNAAMAAEAAGQQGKYWEMHEALFANQETWGLKQFANSELFEVYAEELDLDLEQFRTDRSSQVVRDRIERDKSSGRQLGVNGTPSFFLDGEKIPNPRSYADFKSFIDAALIKAVAEGRVPEATAASAATQLE